MGSPLHSPQREMEWTKEREARKICNAGMTV